MTWKDEIKKFKQGPPTKADKEKYSNEEKYFEARKKEMEKIGKLGQSLVFAFERLSKHGFEMSSKSESTLRMFKKALADLIEGVANDLDAPSSDFYGDTDDKYAYAPYRRQQRAEENQFARNVAQSIAESANKLR